MNLTFMSRYLALKNKYPRNSTVKWTLLCVKEVTAGGLPAKGHRGENLGGKNLHAAFLAVEPAG